MLWKYLSPLLTSLWTSTCLSPSLATPSATHYSFSSPPYCGCRLRLVATCVFNVLLRFQTNLIISKTQQHAVIARWKRGSQLTFMDTPSNIIFVTIFIIQQIKLLKLETSNSFNSRAETWYTRKKHSLKVQKVIR